MISEAKKILNIFLTKIHGDHRFDEEKCKDFTAYITYEYDGKKIIIRLTDETWSIEKP